MSTPSAPARRAPATGPHSLADKEVILATDLDGTFLGGTLEERRRLYDFIEANRDRIGLVYVTGRTMNSWDALDPQRPRNPKYDRDRDPHEGQIRLPVPDVLITNVGARVADGQTEQPLPVQAQLEGGFARKGAKARAMLEQEPGVSLFEAAPDAPHQVWFYDQKAMTRPIGEVARALGEQAGVNTVVSHGYIMDVLPEGLDKARSIQRTLSSLGLSQREINARVLTAGDSMNDFSMLSNGHKAVMMGNAHEELKRSLPRTARIHRSQENGAAAIQDGLMHFFPHLAHRPDAAPTGTDPTAPKPEKTLERVYRPAPVPGGGGRL